MTPVLSPAVCGRTIRLTWTDGPTRDTTHEHVFHADGTVEWHTVGNGAKPAPAAAASSQAAPERPHYLATDVTEDVCLVSYLAPSGFTLTVALCLEDGEVVGVASNDKQWFPVAGTFEVVT